jgi:hypothetical protein
MAKPLVWLCGNWALPGMAAPLDWLKGRADCRQVEPNAVTEEQAELPVAVIVAQSRPGDVNAEELERQPAGAVVFVLAGPWCEGELRSGTPPAHVSRIPWRRWRCGFEAELAPLLRPDRGGERAGYALPADAQLIARNLRAVKEVKPTFDAVAVCTPSSPFYDALAEAFGKLRIKARRAAPGSADSLASVKLVIYDGWPEVERYRSFRPPPEASRELLLLDWPRPTDAQRAAEAGIHEILALPFLLSDLATAVA